MTASKFHQLIAGSMNIADCMRMYNRSDDKCLKHQSEKLSVFCEQCNYLGCLRCLKEHERHPCRNLQNFLSDKKQQFHYDMIFFEDVMRISCSEIGDQDERESLETESQSIFFYCYAVCEYGGSHDVFQAHEHLKRLLLKAVMSLPKRYHEDPSFFRTHNCIFNNVG